MGPCSQEAQESRPCSWLFNAVQFWKQVYIKQLTPTLISIVSNLATCIPKKSVQSCLKFWTQRVLVNKRSQGKLSMLLFPSEWMCYMCTRYHLCPEFVKNRPCTQHRSQVPLRNLRRPNQESFQWIHRTGAISRAGRLLLRKTQRPSRNYWKCVVLCYLKPSLSKFQEMNSIVEIYDLSHNGRTWVPKKACSSF